MELVEISGYMIRETETDYEFHDGTHATVIPKAQGEWFPDDGLNGVMIVSIQLAYQKKLDMGPRDPCFPL